MRVAKNTPLTRQSMLDRIANLEYQRDKHHHGMLGQRTGNPEPTYATTDTGGTILVYQGNKTGLDRTTGVTYHGFQGFVIQADGVYLVQWMASWENRKVLGTMSYGLAKNGVPIAATIVPRDVVNLGRESECSNTYILELSKGDNIRTWIDQPVGMTTVTHAFSLVIEMLVAS